MIPAFRKSALSQIPERNMTPYVRCSVSLHSSEERPDCLHAVEAVQLRGNHPP